MSKAETHPKVLKLRLFGRLQACLGEKPLPPLLRSRKGEWLLALLALRGSPVSRSWLAGTLWPESGESRALLYLRRELMYLRNALGPEGDRLISAGRSLHLDLTGADCDLLTFDAAIARGDDSSLEMAVSLYSGPLLEGCDEEWAIPERESRAQAYLYALERLAEADSYRGDTVSAVGRLRSVAARDPLRESAQRLLMKILADSGDSAAAVQVYRDLRLYLRREMNADVDPATTALFHHIRDKARRRSSKPSSASRTTGTTRADHEGHHEGRIVRIPVPMTPMIGRNQEFAVIRQRLGHSRCLTLTGTGGVGKTRLSIEIAQEMKDDFVDGVCFVELAALSDASLVSQVVLDEFGLKQTPRQTALETLTDRLRDSDFLLLLDNCEHLIQPCAELAGSLLSACSHLRILATSREPLGIAGESVWRVPSLSVPPAGDSFRNRHKDPAAEVMDYEAVTLFYERAQQARSDFTVTVDTVEPVSQICRRLDGIPLAIELAAARVRSLTVEDINSRLDQRFHLLTGGSRTALPRHQTLRSLIDWSYDLLNESEKALFCRLSVFAGGWTLEAAEQVCAGNPVEQREVLDLLASLSDKSLVVAETVGQSVRYRLLETMRQYARDRLVESGDLEPWRDRHLACFLALVEQADPHLRGAGQQEWLERLEAEYDNIRAALVWSNEASNDGETTLRLCAAVSRFWQVRGYLEEGRRWCATALEQANRVNLADSHFAGHSGRATLARGKALIGAGVLAGIQGEQRTAAVFYEEALAILREQGDRQGVAVALCNLGNAAQSQGNHAAAQALFAEALAIVRELGNRDGIASILTNLGHIARGEGDYPAARTFIEEALSIWRELENVWGVAVLLDYLGNIARAERDYPAARALIEEALGIRRELGNRRGIATSLNSLGNVVRMQGEEQAACENLREALAILRELGDRAGIVSSLESLASLAGERQPVRAACLWSAAARLREELGSPLSPVERSHCDTQVAAVRVLIGDGTTFDRAWHEGCAMSMEQLIDFALAGPGH